jgi:hypothetical protein
MFDMNDMAAPSEDVPQTWQLRADHAIQVGA